MGKKSFLTLGVLPILLATSACGALDDDPMSLASAAMEANDHAAARILLAKLMAEQPDNAELRQQYVHALLGLGDGVGAQAVLEELPNGTLTTTPFAAQMAHAKLLQDRPEDALEWTLKAGASDPLARWAKTGALLALGRSGEATAEVESAVADHPDDARLLALCGEMALFERKVEAAKGFSARALELEPDNLAALMLAGKIATLRQDLATAEVHYAQASRTHPSIVGPLLALAAVQADAGKLDEAGTSLKRLREMAPTHPMGMFLDAKLAFVSGDLDRAHTIMQQAEANLRKVPAAQLLLGEIAHLRGNHEQSIAFLRPFVRDNPSHIHAAMVMAQAKLAVGEPAKALEAIEGPASLAMASPQVLALASKLSRQLGGADPYAARIGQQAAPDDLDQRLALADRAIDRGDWSKAREVYAGLRKDGVTRNVLVLNNAAWAALETGNGAEAMQLARQANALTPDDPNVIHTLGWALLQTGGSKAEALQLLRKAKDAVPGNLQYRWHYGAALAANGQTAEAKTIINGVREFADAGQREHIDALLAQL